MTMHLGNVDASSTIYIPFHTFDSNGASITLTGLAVTDIEIYKNGSTTQRSSDAGYTLLDTDGIDFDGLTGIHGFSIDLSDNTDSGFYAAGSFYWVVVSAVTVDTRTVSFVAATFRIGPAAVNATQWLGTAIATPDTAGYPKTTIKDGTGAGEIALTSGAIDSVTAVGTVTTTTTTTNLTNLPAITANWLTAAGTAADFTTEIQSGLATAAALATAQTSIDDLPTNAELATALGTADDATLAAIAALNNLSAAQVNTEVDTALADIHLDHLLATTYDPASKPGAADALLNELIGDDAGVSQYTANALELAPTGGSAPTVTQIRQEMDSNSTQLAAIVADTNELQTDWANGGRLDLIIDARASQTSVDDLPTNAELATALGTADDAVLSAISALNNLSAAQVNAEVVDVLRTDTIPDSVPADGSLPTAVQALYMVLQFLTEKSVSGTTLTVRKVDGSTSLATYTLDDATSPTSITRAS